MIHDRELGAAILMSLDGATPARLRRALETFATVDGVLDAIADGRIVTCLDARSDLASTWRRDLSTLRAEVGATIERRATRVVAATDPDWPIPIDAPGLPPFLFAEGACFEALTRPRIAIVGTRTPTPHGIVDARELASVLAACGAVVVSGLAFGIDAAAHEGAIDGGGLTVGVTATGLDVAYPSRHRGLWTRVREHGLVVGEQRFGTAPRRELFPIRNRIIAAVSSAVIIVEAAVKGGAMRTATAALDLGVPVYAVPGSRRNPVAEGCNRLIADGANSIIDPLDVAALVSGLGPVAGARRATPLTSLSGDAQRAYRALRGDPATLDELVARAGLDMAAAAGAARELERAGRLQRSNGRLWPV